MTIYQPYRYIIGGKLTPISYAADAPPDQHQCKCEACLETKSNALSQYQGPSLDIILYRLQSVLPYLQKQIRYFDEELATLAEALAKQKKRATPKTRK